MSRFGDGGRASRLHGVLPLPDSADRSGWIVYGKDAKWERLFPVFFLSTGRLVQDCVMRGGDPDCVMQSAGGVLDGTF